MKKQSNTGMLWNFTKGSRVFFIASMLTTVISSLSEMLIPQVVRAAVDNAIGGKPSEFAPWVNRLVDALGGFEYLGQHLWMMSLAVMVIAIVRVTAQYTFRVSTTKAAESLTKNMRDGIFSHIERLPYSWHMKNRTGDTIQRCTSDIDMIKRFFSEQIINLFRIVLMLSMSLWFMFSMDVRLTMIAVIPVPFILAFSIWFRTKMQRGFKECDENEALVSDAVQENLTGVRVVRAFGQERTEKAKFEAKNNHYTGLWVKLGGTMSFFWSMSDFLAAVQILLVTCFGAWMCVNGRITSGEYIAFFSYNARLIFPIRMLGRVISEMSKVGVSADRIAEIVNAEEERDPGNAGICDMAGDIVFDHVSFGYDESVEILHDISFTMEAGTTLGILGGTGSGKSTIMMLLDKLYTLPEGQGTISIGGTDIRNVRTDYLRDNIGFVLQEPFLFSRSIEENIKLTVPDATAEEVRRAAADACLDETIESFTKGYDTFVGERGVTLSGGQKQRTAIARTLIKNTPIMIFDDSLSAVDTETDMKIRKSLETRFGSAAIILISHRITTLSKADKILVMDGGRIIEQGTHDELKSAGGFYQQVYELQAGIAGEVSA